MKKQTRPLIPRSSVQGIGWPALPGAVAASMLAVQYQLEESQWWPAEVLRKHQLEQLRTLLSHAFATVPFYTERFAKAGLDPASAELAGAFESLPLLKRAVLQSSADALASTAVPPGHGRTIEHQTSGSTGRPIKTRSTAVTQFFWNAITLRDHIWHSRDLTGKLAAIRTAVQDGRAEGWGPSTDIVYATGPSVSLNIRAGTLAQMSWLIQEDPDYLLSHPSNILALAKLSMANGIKVPSLKEVRAFGETVTQELREACRRAWGVQVVDAYSAQETGYIALQCPSSDAYHIQSESVLVEILDEKGRQCAPGETGRVVVTTLNNFAMPLIRYEILDYAEAGPPCACGRGLPVINRVLGRARNMVTLPDGTEHWPSFPAEKWAHLAPVSQIQLVQKSLEEITARTVASRPLVPEEEKNLAAAFQESLGYRFRITFEYLDEIPRSANFKYEDFVSEVRRP